MSSVKKKNPPEGYGIERLFRCLFLQFLEDLSDGELEVFLRENNAGKWFYGFGLLEDVPDHTVFMRARSQIGTNLLSKLFEQLRKELKIKGDMNRLLSKLCF